ncbi:MAG: ATP-binding cassette domain-containing protein [Deltaproteobacteria bacterium]|nr:ATP-binding cassette domain-containing protein [Deltaproteobacteria bacterium]
MNERRSAGESPPLLAAEGVTLHYGAAQTLFGVTLHVAKGETVALVGSNGAGKTTFLKALLGLLPSSGGRILLEGREITHWPATRRVHAGVALSPEGREVFPTLTVRENLELGVLALRIPSVEVERRVEEIYDRFPRLGERRSQPAGTLSGGVQQMVAIGRALMAAPRLLLLDEPSLGLAPRVADEIFESLHRLTRSGMTILLVEQNAARALRASARAYLLANGRVVGSGRSEDLLVDPELRRAFLGAAAEDGSCENGAGAVEAPGPGPRPPPGQGRFQPSVEPAELASRPSAGRRRTLGHATGRTDDGIAYRGVTLHPSSVDAVLSKIPGLGSEYQLHLSRDASGRDRMKLLVERAQRVGRAREVELTKEVAFQLKHQLAVTPAVDVLEYGTLPRSAGGSRRVFDDRSSDAMPSTPAKECSR